jgi:hypothetical protein
MYCGTDIEFDDADVSDDPTAQSIAQALGHPMPRAVVEHLRACMADDDAEDPEFPDGDDEEGWACWYVNDEGTDASEDPAVAAEFGGSQTVFGVEHPYWRVTTQKGRTFWVIDNPARGCYEFDHITDALYQHVGMTVMLAEHNGQGCPYS